MVFRDKRKKIKKIRMRIKTKDQIKKKQDEIRKLMIFLKKSKRKRRLRTKKKREKREKRTEN